MENTVKRQGSYVYILLRYFDNHKMYNSISLMNLCN
jgi:hypothetical protein